MYRLLVVEDEELERQVLRKQINCSQLPIEIVGEAANGREAIKLFKETGPEIIIMDIKMPGMDGLETTRIIKESDSNVEVIFVTAYSRFSYSKVALKLRAADYLLKPVRPSDLVGSIKRVIGFIEDKRVKESFGSSFKVAAKDDEETEQATDNLLVKKIKGFICENYNQRLTLDMIAEFVYYNPSYISSLFKKLTGQGITDYITELRIKQAKELLLSTNKSMDEIANEVGLNNNSYLTAIFKKRVHVSPSEYRKQFSKVVQSSKMSK
jgi:two-component system response regulator YesN